MKNKIKKIIEKKNKSKIVCLTAYSKNISKILDKYCDIILVGDSMANVLYGYENTHKITLENIIQHTQSVKKGIKKSLLVVDMPIGSYKSKKIALKNAQKIIKKTGCDAVKIESNKKNFNIIETLVKKNIPVMGHIGFTPQFKKRFGAFSIVLECLTPKASKQITNKLKIPTIGIGSSINCDGQVLVTDDMLGLSGFYPKFVKKYTNLKKIIENAVKKYTKEVKISKFPSTKNFLNATKSR